MNRRRLIESLLASGRQVHPVRDDIRRRVFARAVAAAAEAAAGQDRERACGACRSHRLLRRCAARHRRPVGPRRFWSLLLLRQAAPAWWMIASGPLRTPRSK